MYESQTNNASYAKKIDLGQRDYLIKKINEALPQFDKIAVWDQTEDLTEKQYKYLLYLYYNKKDEELEKEIKNLLGL